MSAPNAVAPALKWQGQCPHCNAWNSLAESRVEATSEHRYAALAPTAPVQSLGEVQAREDAAAAERCRGVRSRARRRTRRRRRGADRWRSGYRQVDAAAAVARRAVGHARRCCMSAARSRRRRWRCAHAGSGSTRRRSACCRRLRWSASLRRSARRSRPSSSSIRSRRCTRVN